MIEHFQDVQGMILIRYRVAEGLLCVSIDEEGEHSAQLGLYAFGYCCPISMCRGIWQQCCQWGQLPMGAHSILRAGTRSVGFGPSGSWQGGQIVSTP